jgi:tRNA (mo5U34)-methyltransferase
MRNRPAVRLVRPLGGYPRLTLNLLAMTVGLMDQGQAEALRNDPKIVWHQRFQLAEQTWSPGAHDIGGLLNRVNVPERLDGKSVLDIGTTNGGAAFIAERRGASRVVAVDIYPPNWFGFDRIRAAYGSQVEFVQGSVYDLPALLAEQFDYVFFFGVLYHLRHPLLAIDSVRELTRERLYVETAACPDQGATGFSRFFPRDYLGDSSNWFVPSVTCVTDWFASSGFAVEQVEAWPASAPERAALVATPTVQTFLADSYEVQLSVTARGYSAVVPLN